jgi:hypothetical protein
MTAAPPKRQYIDLNSLMTRIRTRIVERGAVGIKGIGRLFRIADDNNDRVIDLVNELPKLMGDIGVILNKTELNELIRLLDRDGSGSISYDEFLYPMAPPLNRASAGSTGRSISSTSTAAALSQSRISRRSTIQRRASSCAWARRRQTQFSQTS